MAALLFQFPLFLCSFDRIYSLFARKDTSPKTLRDLTHATEFLTLRASFGAVQLGETFSSCLCVNNETNIDIDGVTLRLEVQTANSKLLVAELGGLKLAVGDSLGYVAGHEVKELGPYVMTCSVSYHHPPS